MKIYTRTGDDGTTGLSTGERVAKDHAILRLCGTLDELNCVLGIARTAGTHEAVRSDLKPVQDHIFQLGAEMAMGDAGASWTGRITTEDIVWLETRIDAMTGQLPPLRNFILPGGSPAAAQIHLARAVCRRAERDAVAIRHGLESIPLIYLNRLSDYLFTLARFDNFLSRIEEEKWTG